MIESLESISDETLSRLASISNDLSLPRIPLRTYSGRPTGQGIESRAGRCVDRAISQGRQSEQKRALRDIRQRRARDTRPDAVLNGPRKPRILEASGRNFI